MSAARKGGRRDVDVLVIGAGIAGLCAALTAAPRRVLVLCPDEPAQGSSSALAQGGIAAAVGSDDSVELHVGDTLEAASHSADPDAVMRVVGAAAGALHFLESCGVAFDRDGAQRSLHLEAGHRRARVAHAAGDRSGAAIVAALWKHAAVAPHIEIASGWRVVQLLGTGATGIAGARAASVDGADLLVHARETVLATGGLGRLFSRTTNGPHATGDGLAMALAAGARVAALEFVQFHPTALRVAADPLPLLTEALRGAGARLVTARGVAVMAGRHRLGDLAPRDVVARAVWEHAQAGDSVLLDATMIFSGPQAGEFPGAHATALAYGIDPARAPLPVTAAAHYHMGGVTVDADGRTTLPGLWACGEVACTGLHGANRLASNSLLEAVVCGQAVGAALAATPLRAHATPLVSGFEARLPDDADQRWQRLRERMWEAMGPVRNATDLGAALAATHADVATMSSGDVLLRDRFNLAAAMLAAALARRESRGAHWRSDYPQRDVSRDGPQAVLAG